MSEEIFVDASAPFVWSEKHPLAFFKSNLDNTFLYANRAGRIAMDGDRYRFALIRNRKKESTAGGGTQVVTKGGLLTTQIDVSAVVGTPEDEAAWTEAIKRDSPFVPPNIERLKLRPLGLRGGVMTISGLEGLVEHPEQYRGIEVGMQSTVPITLPLTGDGADTLWRVLGTPVGMPITVRFDYKYDACRPGAHYRITADTRKVYEYFGLNTVVAASWFGFVTGRVDISVVCEELTGSGALTIEWIAKPEGFDESRIKVMEESIVAAFAKQALDLMVEDVVADPQAPDPDGYFGGVSVKLKSFDKVQSLSLSGEYKENTISTETYSYAFTLGQLRNLDPRVYGVDVAGENEVPISVNLGRDERHVRGYSCQYGYRRPDGIVVSAHADALGSDGLMLNGVIQWDPRDPRPEHAEIQFAADWNLLAWEDYANKLQPRVGDSGVLFTYTPGSYVRTVGVLCDFAKAAPGTTAFVEWRTVLPPNPDGSRPKNYDGSFMYVGAGPAAEIDKHIIEFPYRPETVADARFEWEATLVTPDGKVWSRSGSEPVERASAVLAVRALLKPVPDNAGGAPARAARVLAGRR
ncbi:hypothetical protein Ade02nite_47040 [Paractinoplanes deccanensis]|uniref:Uncharacterized protein n=1 Tax=Paractinoplanes deccanensis TaxID=113561 RepID=A0ABQ3Y7V9_9ACTN|nr:hypothetical protein [Actinoplanes deccanensis]GID76063.1 hypothetical protein Ade02nite_47040 [Actinoplanes deccanensis]